ncbi:MAG: type II toxin-antitoxin system VapC family toxin [Actinobacteria bacterium]|nr:type II toxin-antitoxin system VapC family toxin [Actinomycetota bacterium]
MCAIDVVSDASVALKWFHAAGEEEVESARALLAGQRRRTVALSILDLTPHELGNALIRGRAAVGAEQVATVLEALAAVCPKIVTTTEDLSDAARLAEEHNLTLYDAAYAAVARRRGAQLATLDRELLEAGLGRKPSDLISELPGDH